VKRARARAIDDDPRREMRDCTILRQAVIPGSREPAEGGR
jgi:hypothetical protein